MNICPLNYRSAGATACLQKIQKIVKTDKNLNFYSKDHKDDLLYDIEKVSDDVKKWKAHIMRTVNQEMAKQDIIENLDSNTCILDWAMKFLQLRFREKQNDWYAVISIIEDVIIHLKAKNQMLNTVFLRSDEAGCYHNNYLIAALKDISKRVGVTIQGYY